MTPAFSRLKWHIITEDEIVFVDPHHTPRDNTFVDSRVDSRYIVRRFYDDDDKTFIYGVGYHKHDVTNGDASFFLPAKFTKTLLMLLFPYHVEGEVICHEKREF